MNRDKIAERIAEELLDTETLDINNFSGDAEAILQYTQDIVLKHLQDYIIVAGEIL